MDDRRISFLGDTVVDFVYCCSNGIFISFPLEMLISTPVPIQIIVRSPMPFLAIHGRWARERNNTSFLPVSLCHVYVLEYVSPSLNKSTHTSYTVTV